MSSTTTTGPRPSAIVWINGRHAIVARTRGADTVSMVDVDRGVEAETEYLAHVVHEIGDRERVLILGPSSMKLALEREYVSISHRPDRLVAAPPSGGGNEADFVDRLRRLAA